LSEQPKDENKRMASERVCVENGFAGLKRFRILSDRLRLHRLDVYDVTLGVCAGLWNFYLVN
jgi:DDE superfamily endonuclease